MSSTPPRAGAAVPATPAQEALFWLHQRAADRSLYNLTWRLGCAAEPDPAALAAAWAAVVDRHEALRAVLRPHDRGVELDVRPAAGTAVRELVVDDPGGTPADALLRLLAEEVHQLPLALDRPPPARLVRVRVGGEHELLLTAHHAVVDGWGMQLLLADLATAYAAAQAGRPADFGGPAPGLREHAVAAAADQEPSLAYWRDALAGARAATVVADRPGPRRTGGPGAVLTYQFSPEAAAGLAALAGSAFATPFAVLLAALHAVLAAGGAGPDTAVGVVVAGRVTPAEQRLVGYLANVCVSRLATDSAEPLTALVERARDQVWATLAHQGVPYPRVHRSLPAGTRAALGDTPPVLLDFLGPIGAGLRLGDVPLELRTSPNRTARADIGIAVAGGGADYRLEVEYDTGRYEPGTVLGLLHDLDAVLGTPAGRPLGRLPVTTRTTTLTAEPPPPAAPARAAGPAADPTVELVGTVWARLLGSPPAGPDEDFYAVGGRSLLAFDLVAALEAASGRSVDLLAFLARPTPAGLAAQLAGPAGGPPAGTLVPLRDGPGRHVHLLPGAGGTLADYRELVAALPADWRVTGSQEREPLPGVPETASRFHADLTAAGPPPDLLLGWSMGGQVGFALAGAYGEQAPPLAVLDAAPPIGYDPGELAEEKLFRAFATIVSGRLDLPPDGPPPRATGELAGPALAAWCAAAAGDPTRAPTAAALTERWTAYRRHAAAVAGFVATEPVRTPALLVAADLTDAELDRWSALLEPAPARLRLATDHAGLLRDAAADQVAAALRAWEPASTRRA